MLRLETLQARTCRGGPRPWKKRNTFHPIHASQRPPAPADIDFSTLDLKYKLTYPTDFQIPRTGWSPPPPRAPDLPFAVRGALGTKLSPEIFIFE